jgi:16S rRNA (uracil1498-N3)-methyltransferase
MKRGPRLYVHAPLSGANVALDADAAHRLRNVLRLGPGDAVRVFNAASGEFDATIGELAKSRATLAMGAQVRPPGRDEGPWLVVAAIKRAPLDLLVEKATELGATAIHPILTARTNVERVNVARLREIAVSAAEQCERLDPPEIAEPETLRAKLANWPADRSLLLCAEAGESLPLAQALGPRDLSAPFAVMTGPEGGFAPDELAMLAQCPSVIRAGLGPTILRADTAALAALAVFQALSPRGEKPPRAFD